MGLSFGTHQAFKNKKRTKKIIYKFWACSNGFCLQLLVQAAKSKKIICLTGEGGFLEFATIMHHKLPIKTFIYNNGGYLTIKQTQQLGLRVETDYFSKWAESQICKNNINLKILKK